MYGSNAFPIGPNGQFIYKERVNDFGNSLPTQMYFLEDDYDEYNVAAQIPAPEKNFDFSVFGARQKLQRGRVIREGLDKGAESGFSPRYGRKYTSGSSDIGMSGYNVGKGFYEDAGLGRGFRKKMKRMHKRIRRTAGKITKPVGKPVSKVVPGGKIVYKASQVHGLGSLPIRPIAPKAPVWGSVVPKVSVWGSAASEVSVNKRRNYGGWWDRLFGGHKKQSARWGSAAEIAAIRRRLLVERERMRRRSSDIGNRWGVGVPLGRKAGEVPEVAVAVQRPAYTVLTPEQQERYRLYLLKDAEVNRQRELWTPAQKLAAEEERRKRLLIMGYK